MFGGDCGVWRGFVMFEGVLWGLLCLERFEGFWRGFMMFGGVLWGLRCLGVFVE